jgi:hypothetical protein
VGGDRRELAPSADERAGGTREVRAVGGPQRRERPHAELIEGHRVRDVAQVVLAEVDATGSVVETFERGLGEHDLSAMGSCRDAGSDVDVLAHVPFVRDEWCAGVDTATQAEWSPGECGDDGLGGTSGAGRGSEGQEEGIALGVHLDPGVRPADRTHDPPVLGEDVAVGGRAELAEEPR